MSTFRVDIEGLPQLTGRLSRMQKQVSFAMVGAINDVTFDVMRAGRKEITRALDRPTPYTVSSWRVLDKATRNSLSATVGFSDYFGNVLGVGPDQKLKQQFIGGPRRRTGTEAMLQSAGMLPAGRFLVPGSGVKLNRYGNISPGELSKIRSQLSLGNDPTSFSSGSVRSRRNVSRSGCYFWSYGRGSVFSRSRHLAPGVWLAKGGTIHPVLLSARAPVYERRIHAREIGEQIVRRDIEAAFTRRFAQAISTAR